MCVVCVCVCVCVCVENTHTHTHIQGISRVPGGMRLLSKIYELVQAGKCLFSMFYDDRFEQPEADSRVFRKFDDGNMEIVVVVHVDDILAHAKATMERFTAELGGKFKVKSMVEKFGVEKTKWIPASSGVPTLSPSG